MLVIGRPPGVCFWASARSTSATRTPIPLFRRRRHRRCIALIALLGLLFQQLAMAAYVCPMDSGIAGDVAAASSPQHLPCHPDAAADQVRCHQHCHPITPSPDHHPPLTVPAALIVVDWPTPVAASSASGPLARVLSARSTAPPLTVLHCTFQI